jgi:hypothetical protein
VSIVKRAQSTGRSSEFFHPTDGPLNDKYLPFALRACRLVRCDGGFLFAPDANPAQYTFGLKPGERIMASGEDLMDKTLRWMSENLDGAYRARYPSGHEKAGEPCTNSGTAIIVCCYINALGKVLRKGGVSTVSEHFMEFVNQCMPDLVNESKQLPAPEGKVPEEYWLYKIYRCGFVHSFYPNATAAWHRSPSANYWLRAKPPTLNIDRLVQGFTDGVAMFRQKAVADTELRTNFKSYITAVNPPRRLRRTSQHPGV